MNHWILVCALAAGPDLVVKPEPGIPWKRPEPALADKLWGDAIRLRYSVKPLDADRLYATAERAAALGSIDAMTMLGDLYHRGEGRPRDEKKSQEWYRKAAAARAKKKKKN